MSSCKTEYKSQIAFIHQSEVFALKIMCTGYDTVILTPLIKKHFKQETMIGGLISFGERITQSGIDFFTLGEVKKDWPLDEINPELIRDIIYVFNEISTKNQTKLLIKLTDLVLIEHAIKICDFLQLPITKIIKTNRSLFDYTFTQIENASDNFINQFIFGNNLSIALKGIKIDFNRPPKNSEPVRHHHQQRKNFTVPIRNIGESNLVRMLSVFIRPNFAPTFLGMENIDKALGIFLNAILESFRCIPGMAREHVAENRFRCEYLNEASKEVFEKAIKHLYNVNKKIFFRFEKFVFLSREFFQIYFEEMKLRLKEEHNPEEKVEKIPFINNQLVPIAIDFDYRHNANNQIKFTHFRDQVIEIVRDIGEESDPIVHMCAILELYESNVGYIHFEKKMIPRVKIFLDYLNKDHRPQTHVVEDIAIPPPQDDNEDDSEVELLEDDD